MSVLSIETELNSNVEKLMSETHERLQGYNIIKNPFKGGVFNLNYDGKKTYIIVAKTLYPPIYLFGLPMFFIALYFTGFTWFTFPGALLFCLGIFWSRYILLLGVILGFKKAGYKGKWSFLTNSEAIRRIYKI